MSILSRFVGHYEKLEYFLGRVIIISNRKGKLIMEFVPPPSVISKWIFNNEWYFDILINRSNY